MSGDLLDIAVMCPDAAGKLLEKDKRFEIVGPCLVNSDIIVTKLGVIPRKVAFTRSRSYQEQVVTNLFGRGCATVPTLTVVLPYAYKENEVDGVVIDVLQGLLLDGNKETVAPNNSDLVTYVLVVRKTFKDDSRFKLFIDMFRQSAEELNRPDVLQNEMTAFKKIKFTREELEIWHRLRVKYIFKMPSANTH